MVTQRTLALIGMGAVGIGALYTTSFGSFLGQAIPQEEALSLTRSIVDRSIDASPNEVLEISFLLTNSSTEKIKDVQITTTIPHGYTLLENPDCNQFRGVVTCDMYSINAAKWNGTRKKTRKFIIATEPDTRPTCVIVRESIVNTKNDPSELARADSPSDLPSGCSVAPPPPPPPPVGVCGNNILEQGEECDGGYECDSTCHFIRSQSSSSSSAINPPPPPPPVGVCGNNILEQGEECDDGNSNNDDGCSESCLKETTDTTGTLIDISDTNPDEDDSAVGAGQTRIGSFRFTGDVERSSSGSFVTLQEIIFTVHSANVQFDNTSFHFLAHDNVSQSIAACQPFTMDGTIILDPSTEGDFLVWCVVTGNRATVAIGNPNGASMTERIFDLEGYIINPQVDPASESTVQVSLDHLTDSSELSGLRNNHIRWKDGNNVDHNYVPFRVPSTLYRQ